jgi:hypothetical protein
LICASKPSERNTNPVTSSRVAPNTGIRVNGVTATRSGNSDSKVDCGNMKVTVRGVMMSATRISLNSIKFFNARRSDLLTSPDFSPILATARSSSR